MNITSIFNDGFSHEGGSFDDSAGRADGSVKEYPGRESVAVQDRVRALLGQLYPRERPIERREEKRYPYPILIRLVPFEQLDPESPFASLEAADSVTVVGHKISETGIGFFHQDPLPYRRVVVELSADDGNDCLYLLVDLSWCRFTRKGWYESGGKFLQEISA